MAAVERGGAVYCAPVSAGPCSCSGIECGALDMIPVPSLIPAPLSRPVWGLSSRSAGRWPGTRRGRRGDVGWRGPNAALIQDLLPRQPRCFFHAGNAEHGRRLHACWFSVSLHLTPYINPPPPLTSAFFYPLNQPSIPTMTLTSYTNSDIASCMLNCIFHLCFPGAYSPHEIEGWMQGKHKRGGGWGIMGAAVLTIAICFI